MSKKKLQYLSLLLFLTYLLNICVPCISVWAEAMSTSVPSFSDLAGHWAEKRIGAWTARELAGGYPDGTFRPNNPITRAEFLTLVNRAFGYTDLVGSVGGRAIISAVYCDVAGTDWYAVEIAKAAVVGYLGGYPDGTVKPQNLITRQEAAALFAKILPVAIEPSQTDHDDNLHLISDDVLKDFTDEAQIPAWSREAIVMAVNGSYMNGYPDGTFQPARPITRAEAISVIDRAVGTLYNYAGTYGPIQGTTLLEGNVTIATPSVTLRNTTITGNLYLTEGIGEGDVTLDNVTVQGTTKIGGGGRNSIHLLNTTVGAVLVNVPNRNIVRLLAQGSTNVGTLEARTPAILEEEGLTGSGFTKIVINTQQAILSQGSTSPQEGTGKEENTGTENNTPAQETEPGITIELLGDFSEVELQSAAAQINLQKGSIANLNLASTAQAAQINLATQTSINTLTADTPATVQGQGAIERIEANVDGVVVEASIIGAEIKKKKSKDATLSDLTIDGTTVTGFAPDTLFYEIILSEETKTVPNVAATAHHAKAKVTITQATGLPGRATVLVTAENGSTQTYKVNFVKATVSGIAVKTAQTKTTYIEDDLLDLTGLVITLTRTDKSIEEIAFADFGGEGITANPAHGTSLTPANNKVTITHTASEKSVEQGITVTPTYTVTVATVSGGTADVTVDKPKAKAGDIVTVSISNLESGKKFKAITVTSASGDVLTTEKIVGEKYTFIMPAEAVTVTAKLEAITYTVTFDENSGNVEADPRTMTVTYGNAVGTLPTAPTKEGYSFAGWNTEVDGTGDNFTGETVVTNNITVYAQWVIKVTGVTLNKTELFLQVGTTATEPLIATVEPTDATNQNVTWASDNTGVATVDTDGVVTAVDIGEAIITVTTEDGGYTATCTVNVVDSTPVLKDCILYLDGSYGSNDPTTQTWYDLSGKGNDGTLTNFDYAAGSGWMGQGLEFDGVDDYVDCGRAVVPTNVTIEMLAYFNDVIKRQDNFWTNNNSVGVYVLRVENKSIMLALNNTGQDYIVWTTPQIITTGLHHIIITQEGMDAPKIYLDGVQQAVNQATKKGNPIKPTTALSFSVGRKGEEAQGYFNGIIGGIRIYNRALSPKDIAQNYLATKNPAPLSLVDGAVLDLRGTEGTKDPATTVWQDASGQGNDGTLINFDNEGSGSWTEEGLSFNGVDDYVDCGNDASLAIAEQMTISTWFKPSLKTTIEPVILCKNDEYLIRLDKSETPRVHFYVSNGNQYWEPRLISLQSITLDEWHHVVAVWDKNSVGSEMKLYVDNVKVEGSRTIVPTPTENPLRIGYWHFIDHFTDHFKGTIGDVRIYPRALTDAEVLQNYLAGKKSP